MKVIVDDQVFDTSKNVVGVILGDEDKRNIENMSPDCSIYVCYPSNYGDIEKQRKHIARLIKDKY